MNPQQTWSEPEGAAPIFAQRKARTCISRGSTLHAGCSLCASPGEGEGAGGQQRPGPWSGYAVGRHSDTPVVRLLFPLSSRAGPQGRRSGSGSAVPPCETFSLTGCASLAAFPPAAWRLRLHISGTPCGELEETHAFLHARKPIAGSHKLPGTKMSLHLSVTVPD